MSQRCDRYVTKNPIASLGGYFGQEQTNSTGPRVQVAG
jgi:hypothetical protein